MANQDQDHRSEGELSGTVHLAESPMRLPKTNTKEEKPAARGASGSTVSPVYRVDAMPLV